MFICTLENTGSSQPAILRRFPPENEEFLLIFLILAAAVLCSLRCRCCYFRTIAGDGNTMEKLNNSGLYNDGGFRPNGHELWKRFRRSGSDIEMVESSPAVVNGVCLCRRPGDPGHLFAINANTGAIKWEKPLSHGSWASPAVANGMVVYWYRLAWRKPSPGTLLPLNASTGGNRLEQDPA